MNHEQRTGTEELPTEATFGLEPAPLDGAAPAEVRKDSFEPARQRWLEVLQPDAEQVARFDEIYIGDYASLAAYGQALADQSGWREQIGQVLPDVALANVRFDHEGIACDLWLSGQLRVIDHADGMWLYLRHLEPAEQPPATPNAVTGPEGG